MARFAIGRPIETSVPSVTVDAGLRPGAHRFQLEVIDAAGNRSAPDVAVIAVRDRVIPTDTTGPTIPGPTGPVVRPGRTGTRPVVTPDPAGPGPVIRPDAVRPDVVRPGVVRPGVTRPRSAPKPQSPSKRSKPK